MVGFRLNLVDPLSADIARLAQNSEIANNHIKQQWCDDVANSHTAQQIRVQTLSSIGSQAANA